MAKLFITLFTITIASIIAMWFIENDGRIIIEWLGYRIQTSVAFIILTSVIALVVCTIFLQFIIWLKNAPKRYRKSSTEKKREQGLTALTEGFAAIEAGDTNQAKRLTKQAINCLGNIPLTKLIMARTAQLEGNVELAKIHYQTMLENKETEVIAIKGLLIQAKNDGDLNNAILLAEKAHSIQPTTEWAITILIDLYKITHQWDKAEQKIIYAMKKIKSINKEQLNRSLSLVYLAQCEELIHNNKIDNAAKYAHKAYKLLPNFAPIAINYAKILAKQGNKRKAVKTLETSWKTETFSDTAQAYLEIFNNENSEKKLKRAEKLLSIQPNSVDSHIIVAQTSISAGESSKARNHLKIALSITETRTICKLMAELEKEDGANNDVVQQWLQRAETSNADPLWSCQKCSSLSKQWQLTCNNCQSFDSLKWGQVNNKIHIIEPNKQLLSAA